MTDWQAWLAGESGGGRHQACSWGIWVPVSAPSLVLLCELKQTPKLICEVRVWNELVFTVLSGFSGPCLCHRGAAEVSTTPEFQSLGPTL